jgi:hypothetical protein
MEKTGGLNLDQNRVSVEPLSLLLLEEKKYQQQLDEFKKELARELQAITVRYQKEWEAVTSKKEEPQEIQRVCRQEVARIENDFQSKLREEIERLEREWLMTKSQRKDSFLKIILSEKFYD